MGHSGARSGERRVRGAGRCMLVEVRAARLQAFGEAKRLRAARWRGHLPYLYLSIDRLPRRLGKSLRAYLPTSLV